MTDFLDALLARNTPQPAAIRPRPRALFEPQPESGAVLSPRPEPGEDEEAAPQVSESAADLPLPGRVHPDRPQAQSLNAPLTGAPSAPQRDPNAGRLPASTRAQQPAGAVQPAPPQPEPTWDASREEPAAGAPPEPARPSVLSAHPAGSRSAAAVPGPSAPPAPTAVERSASSTTSPAAASGTNPAVNPNRPVTPLTLPNANLSSPEEGSRYAASGPAQDPGRTVRVQPGQAALPAAPARPAAATDASPPQSVTTQPEPQPVIHVSIGRIEVRASPPSPAQTAPRTRQAAPPVNLEDYLRRNSGDKR